VLPADDPDNRFIGWCIFGNVNEQKNSEQINNLFAPLK